jgi:hypothetical protein
MSVVQPRRGNEQERECLDHSQGALLTVRSLVILVAAGIVALAVGFAAGVSSGLAVSTAGTGWSLAVGVASGFAAAVVTGAGVASRLHALLSYAL